MSNVQTLASRAWDTALRLLLLLLLLILLLVHDGQAKQISEASGCRHVKCWYMAVQKTAMLVAVIDAIGVAGFCYRLSNELDGILEVTEDEASCR